MGKRTAVEVQNASLATTDPVQVGNPERVRLNSLIKRPAIFVRATKGTTPRKTPFLALYSEIERRAQDELAWIDDPVGVRLAIRIDADGL